MGELANRVCAGTTVLTLIVSFFLIGYSFDTLHPQVMALMYDANKANLECKLYEASGRYYTGLGVGFYDYRFPVTATSILLHNLPFADGPIITTKTFDGVSISAGVSFQYRYERSAAALCDIVNRYGVAQYEQFVISYARGAVRDAIGQFAVSELWTSRPEVASAVKAAVGAALRPHHAILANLQLQTLDIPDSIQNEIENTTVQGQRITQAELSQQAARISSTTRLLQAQVAAQAQILAAAALANATLYDAKARSAALNLTVSAEAEAYASLKDALQLSNEQVVTLAYIDAILSAAGSASGVTVRGSIPDILKIAQ